MALVDKGEYFLVAVPARGNPAQAKKQLDNETAFRSLSSNNLFRIPALKVGTLDSLMSMSDELVKTDAFMEAITVKLATYLAELLEQNKAKLAEALVVGDKPVRQYIETFEWDHHRFNAKMPIKELVDSISKEVSRVDLEMKSKMQAFNKAKGNLSALERKANGSLLMRSLAELVSAKHFVLDSEYLVTLLVVVPKFAYNEWMTTYETLSDLVVPRSSSRIAEDAEFGLFNVTVFRKMVEDFKTKARERRFVVRDFEYDPEEIKQSTDERKSLQTDIQKKFGTLSNWCKVAFEEVSRSWLHLKAVRVFVESVLRYGLPVDFVAVTLRVQKSSERSLRSALLKLYKGLDVTVTGDDTGMDMLPGIVSGEYYPYVNCDVKVTQLFETR